MALSLLSRIRLAASRGVVRLPPVGRSRGRVLLSYLTEPFFDTDPAYLAGHTNRWECVQIARTFQELGYGVDVIDWQDRTFMPRHPYAYAIDIHANLERWADHLPASCVKIFHATGAHWLFQNAAEYERLLALQRRRGTTLAPVRAVPPSFAAERADVVTVLGNAFTRGTYAYAGKPLHSIPLSTTHEFPFPEDKDIAAARTNFIWFAGGGAVHKGLDVTLEAFSALPEYRLTVCGKIEPEFERAYEKELTQTPNITYAGWMSPDSEAFRTLCDQSIGMLHPSCSEGYSGATVLALHAGLIPLVSRETGIDIEPFGVRLPAISSEAITAAVREIAQAPEAELRERMRAGWAYAREHHTRDRFAAAYRSFAESLESRDS